MAVAQTLICFLITYFGLALGRLPGLRIDRAGIALVGASAIMALGLLGFSDAVNAIDFDTLALLFGMMIVVGFLHRAGFFASLTDWLLTLVKSSYGLLAMTMLLSGFLSALLVNDVVCLALTPLIVRLARQRGFDPVPHLIALAIASNIGSVATLTGNPQNMMIGGFSGIGYVRFASKLTPVALLGLLLAYVITLLVFRRSLQKPARQVPAEGKPASSPAPVIGRAIHRTQRSLLIKSLVVTVGAVVLFFAGAHMAIVALAAASLLLLDRLNPKKIYQQVDWNLLVMFAGLFVVVHAFEIHILHTIPSANWQVLIDSPIIVLSLFSALLSNIVSNVPAVLLFKPIITTMAPEVRETAWLALAMSSTLAGNLTVLGSVANLIVVEGARREGVLVTFGAYARVGVPVTVLTMLIGIAWLRFVPY